MFLQGLLLGVGATLTMDVWAEVRRRAFGLPSLDYRLVGRWLGRMPHGELKQAHILQTPPVRGEAFLGWGAHFLIGAVFGLMFLAVAGADWLDRPSLVTALTFGAVTVLVPFLIMQPALGLGVAASRTPKPWVARARSLATHLVFGAGLYLSAYLVGLTGLI
ncbi:MAG: DUF2938 domain-containing protein [Pseudomonadota bacterium]